MKWLVATALLLVAGCGDVPNPAYCDENSDCKNGFSCNLTTHGCEVASDAAVDTGTASCTLDDECSSGVCRNDGSCEDAANVLYVSPDGISAGDCPREARCDLVYALSKASPTLATIRLANGTYDLAADIVVDHRKPDLTLVGGRSAVVQRAAAGVAIEVRGVSAAESPALTLRGMTINKGLRCYNGELRLQRVLLDNAPAEAIPWIASEYCTVIVEGSELRDSPAAGISGMYTDLEMVDSTIFGSAGIGVSINYGRLGGVGVKIRRSTIHRSMDMGIRVFNAINFELERSTIANNVMGGVTSLGAPYDVTNNFIVRNGNQGYPVEIGGIRVTGSGRVIHNTIAMNNSPPDATYAGGIYCDNGTAANNIIASNQRGNEKLPYAQTRGSCNFTGSLIDMTYSGPVFVDLLIDDFHIASASPAVNAGGMPQVLVDFDGEPRVDGAADLGADERP